MNSSHKETFFTKNVLKVMTSIVAGLFFFIFIQLVAGILAFQLLGKPQNSDEFNTFYVMYIDLSFYLFIIASLLLIACKKPSKNNNVHRIETIMQTIIALSPFIIGSVIILISNTEDWYMLGSITSSIFLFMVLQK